MITVKVGYEITEDQMQVEDRNEFTSFESANEWSRQRMYAEGYDTARFEHRDGEEVMREIIMNYLESKH